MTIRTRVLALAGAGALALGALSSAGAAPLAPLAVTARVAAQTCVAPGTAEVTLQADTAVPAAFRWDLDGDGTLDTTPSRGTEVFETTTYPGGTFQTARVVAVDKAGDRGSDAIAFPTLRCS